MSETPQEPIEGVPDDLVDDVDPHMFVTEYRNVTALDLRDIHAAATTRYTKAEDAGAVERTHDDAPAE